MPQQADGIIILEQHSVPGLAKVAIAQVGPRFKRVVFIQLDAQHDGTVHRHTIDIDDFDLPAGWQKDHIYYAGNDPRDFKLTQFVELCHQWDHDHDGQYDGDAAIKAIERTLNTRILMPFQRPNRGLFTRALMAMMPPAPERHIVQSHGRLQQRFRLHHYLLALPAIAVVMGLMQLQTHFLPWMKYSVLSGAGALGEATTWYVPVIIVMAYVLLSRSLTPAGINRTLPVRTYGFFNKAAQDEEHTFREGAENWNLRQRVTSCLIFGAVHQVNLFYPLATILPLALGGGLFMAVYLRTYKGSGQNRRAAVLEATVTHRVYNRIALTVVVVYLLGLSGSLAASLLGLSGALVLTWAAMTVSNYHHRQTTNPAALAKSPAVA
jgi:hypothetical protein